MTKKLFSKFIPVIVLLGLVFSLTQPATVMQRESYPLNRKASLK